MISIRSFKFARSRQKQKSLLLVGFPRGFTSEPFYIASRATGLKNPRNVVTAGEVLNQERWRDRSGSPMPQLPFYYNPASGNSPEAYPAVRSILDSFRCGYIVKDVVQPWLVLQYLKEYPDAYNVLYVRRDIDRVRFHMERRAWTFANDLEAIDQAFSNYTTLDVQHALYDEGCLTQALRSLGYDAVPVSYIDSAFCRVRDQRAAQFYLAQCNDFADWNAFSGLATPNQQDEFNRVFYSYLGFLGLLEGKWWAADEAVNQAADAGVVGSFHVILEHRDLTTDIPTLLEQRISERPFHPLPHQWLGYWYLINLQIRAAMRELARARQLRKQWLPATATGVSEDVLL